MQICVDFIFRPIFVFFLEKGLFSPKFLGNVEKCRKMKNIKTNECLPLNRVFSNILTKFGDSNIRNGAETYEGFRNAFTLSISDFRYINVQLFTSVVRQEIRL